MFVASVAVCNAKYIFHGTEVLTKDVGPHIAAVVACDCICVVRLPKFSKIEFAGVGDCFPTVVLILFAAPETQFVFDPTNQYKLHTAAFAFVRSTVILNRTRELVDNKAGIVSSNIPVRSE